MARKPGSIRKIRYTDSNASPDTWNYFQIDGSDEIIGFRIQLDSILCVLLIATFWWLVMLQALQVIAS